MSDEAQTIAVEVEDIEAVPEDFRELYAEQEGRYRLKAAPKAKLDEFRENNIKLQKKAAEVDEVKQRLAELEKEREAAREEALAKSQDADQIRETYKARLAEEKAKTEERVTALSQQLDKMLLDSAARAALDSAGMHVELSLPHVSGQVRMQERDGERVAVVVDANGQPRINEQGDFMTVPELVAEMAQQDRYKALRRSTAAGGGGASNSGSGGVSKALKDMTKQEKMDYVDQHGIEKYRELVSSTYGR